MFFIQRVLLTEELKNRLMLILKLIRSASLLLFVGGDALFEHLLAIVFQHTVNTVECVSLVI